MPDRRPIVLVSGKSAELPTSDVLTANGVKFTTADVMGSIAAAPSAGAVRVGDRSFAGADFLAMRAAQGIERLVQPHLARTQMVNWTGTATGTLAVYGSAAPTAGGGTSRTPSSTSQATRAKRTGFVSAATAGGLSSCYGATGMVSIGDGSGQGGFFAVFRFVPSDAATVSGARMFVGLSSNTGAPTNAEPSGLLNQIGVAQLSGSTNLQIVFGGGTAQTAIDLGSNFPASGASTSIYELILFSDPNDGSKVGYRVERLNTGNVAEGSLTNTSPGTTLPSSNTMLTMRMWRTNNATALAVGFDVVSATLLWD